MFSVDSAEKLLRSPFVYLVLLRAVRHFADYEINRAAVILKYRAEAVLSAVETPMPILRFVKLFFIKPKIRQGI